MEFEQIRPQKIYERVAEHIKGMIESGDLKPGDRLPSVVELSERYSVGRSAVREALSALKAMGLVEIKQGEGTFVRHLSTEDVLGMNYSNLLVGLDQLESLLEVRKIIETSYVELAAERRDDQDLLQMKAALAEMEKDLHTNTHGEIADWKFHYAIVKATKNDMLVHIVESLEDSMKRNTQTNRYILFQKEGMPKQLLDEHMDIYKAIEAKDSKKARKLLYNHLQNVEDLSKEICKDNRQIME